MSELRKLLIPGWVGMLTPKELALIKAELKRSARLRRLWGFKSRRISDAAIRRVAMDGVQKSAKSYAIPLETYLGEKGK